jgi:CheY-like chemotaxis protein
MAKILLVEDDNNLREIYEARLQAEGYEIVSAMDGEEALVVAKKEKPDLVISDVMMPRISGFEMLDILRNTDGLKDVKVIMLTALGQAEDKTRADSLGADRYLVKSQVTLEDIVKAAQELLGESPAAQAASTPTAAPNAPAPANPAPAPAAPTPAAVASIPVVTPPAEPTVPVPTPTPTEPPVPATPAPEPPAPAAPTPEPVTPTPPSEPAAPPQPTSAPTAPPVDQPIAQPEPPAPAQDTPADAQPAASAAPTAAPSAQPAAQSTSDEQNAIKAQIESFVRLNSQTAPGADTATPEAPTSPSQAPAEQAPTSDTMMADAIKGLVSDTQQDEAPPTEKTIPAPGGAGQGSTPAAPTPPAPEQSTETEPEQPTPDSDDDSATVAHKKIIKPITDSSAPAQPNLNELLAREGITAIEDEEHPTPPTAGMPPASPLPPAPGGLPTTPHPPGHVISPNPPAQGGVDPNSISL